MEVGMKKEMSIMDGECDQNIGVVLCRLQQHLILVVIVGLKLKSYMRVDAAFGGNDVNLRGIGADFLAKCFDG